MCEATEFDGGDCEEVSLEELTEVKPKKLVTVIDVLGRNVKKIETRQIKFFIYNDGTSKKVININK